MASLHLAVSSKGLHSSSLSSRHLCTWQCRLRVSVLLSRHQGLSAIGSLVKGSPVCSSSRLPCTSSVVQGSLVRHLIIKASLHLAASSEDIRFLIIRHQGLCPWRRRLRISGSSSSSLRLLCTWRRCPRISGLLPSSRLPCTCNVRVQDPPASSSVIISPLGLCRYQDLQ